MIQVSRETEAALSAAVDVLAGGGSPGHAVRAFASATPGGLDDQVVAELEEGLQRILIGLELVVRGAVALGEALADPRVQRTLDQALSGAIDVGYRAAIVRNRLEGWLREGPGKKSA